MAMCSHALIEEQSRSTDWDCRRILVRPCSERVERASDMSTWMSQATDDNASHRPLRFASRTTLLASLLSPRHQLRVTPRPCCKLLLLCKQHGFEQEAPISE